MGNCKNCREWNQDDEKSGQCRAPRFLRHGWIHRQYSEMIDLEDVGEYDFALNLTDPDASPNVELKTGPLFGCVQFQLKSKG